MTKLTTEELEAIQARCDAATEGPWRIEYKEDNERWVGDADYTVYFGDDPFGQIDNERYYPTAPDRVEDATFIAHSRTDVPVLLSHIEAQDARIKELELKLQDVEDEIGWFASEALRDGGEG